MNEKVIARKRRHERIRKKVFGTSERPRVSVYKSLRNIYVQFIDDTKGHTIASASTLSKEWTGYDKCNIKTAIELGKIAAERALDKGIKSVVFDRSGYKYHGCIKALAEAMREKGLDF